MNKYLFSFWWFAATWGMIGISSAQDNNLGVPPIHNYTKQMYKAGTQNWDAAQDQKGILFFANNEGLLQYNGHYWACHQVANRTVVRSVAIDSTGRIFVGAQSELGYFFPEKNGHLRYHSLLHLLPADKRTFEDVWDIAFLKNEVFFRTNRLIFRYANQKMEVFEPKGLLSAMFVVQGLGLVVQQNMNHLLVFQDGAFRQLLQASELKSEITGVMPLKGDTLLLTSLKHGLFYFANQQIGRWFTPNDDLLQTRRIYTATALHNGQFALGTSLDGLLILDNKRRIFRHLNKKNGLQNNNILSAFADKGGNLWLGLDNGIDAVILDAPLTTIIPDGDLLGTGYAAAIFQQKLYLGVSNGVYSTHWNAFFNPEHKGLFHNSHTTDGQVWTLNPIDNDLLLGHHEGSFVLTEQSSRLLSAEPGAWAFVPLSADYMLGGTYSGLILYRKSNGHWVFDRKLKGLNESCRIMVRDADGAVWVAHPYRGLYRVVWSQERPDTVDVQFYNAQNGLPSDLNNSVFQIAGKAVFATEKGVYYFDRSSNSFVPNDDFNRVLGQNRHVKMLREDHQGNIWYVAEKEVGALLVDDMGLKKNVKKRVYPELSEKLVGGFELMCPIDQNNIIFGAEKGFILFNTAQKQNPERVLQVVLHQIRANGLHDTLLFGGWFSAGEHLLPAQDPEQRPVLETEQNNLVFSFSATDYKEPSYIRYRVRLLGLHNHWSDWAHEPMRHFTNLPPGAYTFEVQARSLDERESPVERFSFRIRPPWYASTVAFVLYALGLLGIFAGFLFRQKQKFESEKEQLTVQHQQASAAQQLEVELSKAALNEIKHEKLEAEIRFKNQELASATMHLLQKGELLLALHENLNQIQKKASNPAVKKEIQQAINLLNFDAQLDDNWQQFSYHFDQVHVHFLQRLREQHPHLSANDHKLCAYLRMNLSTKEIAPLMNISIRGVEANRYRLRKKLRLPNDANLSDWILVF